MRDISLDEQPAVLPINTYLIYGDTRTGKTTFVGTMPRPLIFADASEQGWESLKYLSDDQLFEPNIKPIVWAIENMNDMAQAVERAKPLIAAKRVLSIGVDSITFYTDLYLNFLIQLQASAGKAPDNRQAYGALGMHLRDLRVKIHGLGTNVAWLALAKHPDSDDPKGRAMIPGQQGDKFAAGCNFIFHSRTDTTKKDGKIVSRTFELRTKEFGSYIAGSRLGSDVELPDPFVGTYAELITARGYDVDAIRASLPAPIEVKPQAAQIVAKPPIQSPARGVVQPAVRQPASAAQPTRPPVSPTRPSVPRANNNQVPRGTDTK